MQLFSDLNAGTGALKAVGSLYHGRRNGVNLTIFVAHNRLLVCKKRYDAVGGLM